jgi:HK97 family phage prohead protease
MTVTAEIFAGETRVLEGCEVRAVEKAGKRRFEGVAAPWDTWALIGGVFEERFQRNCFHRAITDGKSIPLLIGHDMGSLPVGRSVELRDADAGLEGSWELSDTQRAGEAWELIRDGSLQALSTGFRTFRGQDHIEPADPPAFPRVTRRNVHLFEVSLVPAGAYSDATITTHTRSADIALGRSATPYRDRYAALLERLRYSPADGLTS